MTTAHNIDLPAVLAERLTTAHPDVLRELLATFIHTLAEHGYQNRRVALVEAGSWAPTAAKVMRSQVEQMKDIEFAEAKVTVRGAVDDAARAQIAALADELSK